MTRFISYCRVSTKKQGLGLEAQSTIIANWIAANGGEIIAAYDEKESGKTTNRPALQDAIKQCKQTGAKLIVAKLDRLSRDISDVFSIRKKIDFVVCDMDATDTLTLGIFATLAQKERELISKRTKEALQELKRKGKKLGNPDARNHMKAINAKGCAARKEKAATAKENKTAYDVIRFMNGTLQSKADYLNANGYLTRNGKQWAATSVMRLIKRFAPAQ